MPYIYVGLEPIHHGRKLLKLLCNLKNFGQGRIVYRCDEQNNPEPSFYKILLAQPEMDDKFEDGRVVVEQVQRGVRFTKPINLSGKLQDPDFRLVPKDEEESFCKWSQVRDYVAARDAPLKPRTMEMPPLLKQVMVRNRAAKNEATTESDLLLPAYKIYEGDVRLEEMTEPHCLSKFISDEFATFKGFDVNSIPMQAWNTNRISGKVGHRIYDSYVEGKGWEKRQQKDNLINEKQKNK